MPAQKDTISSILDDAKARILATLGGGKDVPSTPPQSRTDKGPRGAIETRMLQDALNAAGLGLDFPECTADDEATYENVLSHLVACDPVPPAGQRDLRRQHAKRFLDRALERGWLKRDGDLIKAP